MRELRATLIKQKTPDGKLRRGTDAARPHPGLQRRGRDQAARCRRRGQWVLRGDRGITYSENIPENVDAYRGQLVASGLQRRAAGVLFRAKRPGELGLKIGDTVTVNVLGRNITAQDRQPPQCRMGITVDQLRDGVFAEYRSAAPRMPGWQRSIDPRRRRERRDGDPEGRHQHLSDGDKRPRQGARSTSSTASSDSLRPRSARRPPSHSLPPSWCWPARLPPATGPGRTMRWC